MMDKLNKISLKNLHICFFYLFLLSIPFQARKVFLTQYSFYSGSFTEYSSVFVYISDIFLVISLFFWFLLLEKKHKFPSIKNIKKLLKVWLFLIIFVLWIITNIVINHNYFEVSAFQAIKIIEVFFLIIYVYFNLNQKNRLIKSLLIISFSGFFQSLIAICQFIKQQSLFGNSFLHKITGETIIGSEIAGVAKVAIENEKMIRAYGTLPHPNILGGFLILSISISLYLYLKHKDYILSRIQSFYTINNTISQVISSLFWIILIFTQFAALLFTFSRSAWLGLMFSTFFFLLIVYFKKCLIVSRETIYKFKEIFIILILFFILTIPYFSFISSRFNNNFTNINNSIVSNVDISERIFYNIVSRETIKENIFIGSGVGTYIFQIDNYLEKMSINQKLESWQYQPAHNIYFLIASEIGIIGLLLFLLFVVEIFKSNFNIEKINDNKILNYILLSILISFLFIGLFDHYFWTLQQGRLIFWLVLGLILAISNAISK